MQLPTPAELPATDYDLHRGRQAVDRGAVIVAFAVSIVAGVASSDSFDSIAIGFVIGSILFALLAPLLAAATR